MCDLHKINPVPHDHFACHRLPKGHCRSHGPCCIDQIAACSNAPICGWISILFHNIDGMDQIKGTTEAKAYVVISLFLPLVHRDSVYQKCCIYSWYDNAKFSISPPFPTFLTSIIFEITICSMIVSMGF